MNLFLMEDILRGWLISWVKGVIVQRLGDLQDGKAVNA